MDAQTSNNVSRALHDLSGTVGQYAQMAHEERMEQARQQFQQMLEATKEKQAQTQHQIDQAQHESDHQDEMKLEGARNDREAQTSAATLAESHENHQQDAAIRAAELGNETTRTAIDARREEDEHTKSITDRSAEVTARQASALSVRMTALEKQQDFTQAEMDKAESKVRASNDYLIADDGAKQSMVDAATAKFKPIMSNIQNQYGKVSQAYAKLAQLPDDVVPQGSSSSTGAAPAGVSGNKPAGYYKGAGANYGKPVYKDPSGKMTFDSGTAGAVPGAPGGNPQGSVQTDQGTLDTSPAPDPGPAPSNTGAPAAPSQLAQTPATTPPAPQAPPPVTVAQSAPAGSPQAGMPGLLPGQPPQPGATDPNDPSQQQPDPTQDPSQTS